MSRRIYDNWERLVEATLKREQFWQLCRADSISSLSSESFSFPSPSSSIMAVDDKVLATIVSTDLFQPHSTKDTRKNHLPKNPNPNKPDQPPKRVNKFKLLFSLKARQHRKSSQSSSCYQPEKKPDLQLRTTTTDLFHSRFTAQGSNSPPKKAGLNRGGGGGGGSSFISSPPWITQYRKSVLEKQSESIYGEIGNRDLETGSSNSFNSSSPWRTQHREWNVRRPRGRSWVEEGNASAGPQRNEEKVLSKDGDFFSKNKDSVLHLPNPQSGDLVYIFNILRESHSSLDYSVFLLIEKQHYQDTPKASRMQRKLIFDTIKEILHRNTEFLLWKLAFFSSMTNYNITKPSYDKVCCEFLRIRDRESSDDLFQIVDCAIKKDLDEVEITGWRDCPVEMSEVILEMERIIFTDLISETIGDFESRSSLLSRSTEHRQKLDLRLRGSASELR